MALAVIMIVVTLGAALFARVIGNGLIVVARQNTSSALAAADAGVADALFRIDQNASARFCLSDPIAPATPVSGCVTSSSPTLAGVSYEATPTGATQWAVQGVGTSGGMTAAVQESLTRSAAYPFALFGNSNITFNGSSGNGFGTYDSGSTTPANTLGAVEIGSNGTISCNGGLGSNVTAVYYTGGGGISGNCGTPQPVASRNNLPIPQKPVPNLGCPGNGLLGSNNNYPTLAGGTWLCTAPVTIDGNLAVSGPVSLSIILDPAKYNSSTGALTITANSNVNYSPPPAPLPDATRFQVNTNSTGTVGNSNGQGYTFSGILNAPLASLTADGCKSVYYGALVINTLTCNGGPHLAIYYQNNLNQLYGPWKVAGFTQIAPQPVISNIHP